MSFEVGILAIFGRLEASYREELKKNYTIVERGYNSLPTKLPGTPYKKALQVSGILTFPCWNALLKNQMATKTNTLIPLSKW